MEAREFAERVLFGETLADKLFDPSCLRQLPDTLAQQVRGWLPTAHSAEL